MSSADGSFIRNYKEVSGGVELTSEQTNRLVRFFDAAAAEGLPEFQYMLLAFENYLSLGEKRVKEILQESSILKDLIEKNGVLENASTFLDSAKKIESSSAEMSKNMGAALETVKQVESSVKRSGDTIGGLERIVEGFSASCEKAKESLVESLTKTVAENVKKQVKEKERYFQWSETGAKSVLFLTVFTAFAMSFFFMGMLSHEKGLPPWVVVPPSNGNPLYSLFALLFGLPMSWVVFVGISALSGVWLYEARNSKSESRFVEFVQDHWWKFLLVFFGIAVLYPAYAWFFR